MNLPDILSIFVLIAITSTTGKKTPNLRNVVCGK
jgi:hypothetical protein